MSLRMKAFNAWTDLVSGLMGLFSPRGAIDYRSSRAAMVRQWGRAYVAGTSTGPNQNWLPSNKSADSEIDRDFSKITARARDLIRNDPNAAGVLKKVVANVVGCGRYPQARVMTGEELNDRFNSEAENLFEQWSEECDITGQEDYAGLTAVTLAHLITDGEVIIFMSIDDQAERHPLRLTIFEADHLDSSKSETLPNGNVIRRGVEFNVRGKPVRYWMFPTHPGDALSFSSQSKPYPAEKIIHIFDRSRASQTRGVSWFAPLIMRMYDLSEYQDYEIQGAKLASAFGLFITTDGNPFEDYAPDGTPKTASDQRTRLTHLEPGTIKYLNPREKLEVASLNRPNNAYADFIRANQRSASAGMGVSYETFSNDYTSATYSSTRVSLLEERRIYRMIHRLLERQLYTRIWKEFIRLAVVNGLLRAPGYEKDPYPWNRVAFAAPSWEWVDPTKDIQAAIMEVELGISTLTDLCDSKGRDFRDVVKRRAKENALLQEAGLPIPGADAKTPSPPAENPESTQPQEAQPQ